MIKTLKHKSAKLTLGELPSTVMVFGLAVIITSVMGQVLGSVQATQCGAADNLSIAGCQAPTTEYNITASGLTGTTNLATNYSLIGTIIGLVIVVGVLASGFAGVFNR